MSVLHLPQGKIGLVCTQIPHLRRELGVRVDVAKRPAENELLQDVYVSGDRHRDAAAWIYRVAHHVDDWVPRGGAPLYFDADAVVAVAFPPRSSWSGARGRVEALVAAAAPMTVFFGHKGGEDRGAAIPHHADLYLSALLHELGVPCVFSPRPAEAMAARAVKEQAVLVTRERDAFDLRRGGQPLGLDVVAKVDIDQGQLLLCPHRLHALHDVLPPGRVRELVEPPTATTRPLVDRDDFARPFRPLWLSIILKRQHGMGSLLDALEDRRPVMGPAIVLEKDDYRACVTYALQGPAPPGDMDSRIAGAYLWREYAPETRKPVTHF